MRTGDDDKIDEERDDDYDVCDDHEHTEYNEPGAYGDGDGMSVSDRDDQYVYVHTDMHSIV